MSSFRVEKEEYKQQIQLMLSTMKEKSNLMKLMEVLSNNFSKSQDQLIEIRDYFTLENAEGVQLDVIGKIAGQIRNGLSDVEYRKKIKIKIAINNGSGEAEVFYNAIIGLKELASKVQLKNLGNADLMIWINAPITYSDFEEIKRITAAGVNLQIIAGSDDPFVFADDVDGEGFSEVGFTSVGGKLQELFI